ncbi:protein BPS1, chloroplastic-like [Primulina tabacum]|uniref:protein BPS1, chloroplastic-like n=1 Tax=Primulina tabacum TaxID=48773 RepID=UPI003F5A7251
MSRPQEPHKPFLSFGNPFRAILPKGSSYLSPKLLALLNDFEESLAERLKKLKPADKEDVLHLSWMRMATESLCEIHSDIKSLIMALELPVCDWEDKWIDLYFSDSVKLLDICNSFSSEISRLKHGHLYLQCVLHHLNNASSNHFVRACSSLDGWSKHIGSKNPKLDNCFCVMDCLSQTLDLPKIKNSSKGMVLMRAMYGVKVITLFVCSIFATAFSGSSNKLMDLQVPDTCLWATAFTKVQTFVNTELRSIYSNGNKTVLKELETVDMGAKKVLPFVRDGEESVECEGLKKAALVLEKSAKEFSHELDLLAKVIDGFFQIVLTGRDTLLYNLRTDSNIFDQVPLKNNIKNQVIR